MREVDLQMPPHTPHFLFKQLVPKPALKFPRALTGCSDIHRVLTTAEDNVRTERGDTGAVERCFGRVLFHLFERLNVP